MGRAAIRVRLHRPVYLWAGPGTIRMNALKFMGAALDDTAVRMAAQWVRTLEDAGVPLLDAISHLPLDADPTTRLGQAMQAFDHLRPGLTHFIIHAAKDTPELRAITPDWACRAADYRTFLRPELQSHILDRGIHVIGYRALQAAMGS